MTIPKIPSKGLSVIPFKLQQSAINKKIKLIQPNTQTVRQGCVTNDQHDSEGE